ncbi:MAG TPA: DUF4397 domain-containing protein [Candidatus Kapabacteria bacterium]|nr:DUF4397 domain-containing protein [Candidatus Kapabacteria bacterium]
MKHSRTLYLLLLLGAVLFCARPLLAQGSFDVRVVHLMPGAPNVDIYLNNVPTATITDLAYEYTSPLVTRLPVDNGTLNMKAGPAGGGIGTALVSQDFPVATSTEYSAVVYPSGAVPKVIMLARPKSQVPGPGKALVRVLNISSLSSGAIDVYLDSLGSTPIASALAGENASSFASVTGEPKNLYITQAGSKTPLATFTVPLTVSGRLTLIVTGSTPSQLKVYALSGENIDGYKLPVLQGLQGGMQSSFRVVHAWYQPKLQGAGVQPLDVYMDNGTQPRFPNLRYRTASAKYGPLTADSAVVRFAPINEGVASAVFTGTVQFHRDSDYVMILTKTKEGAAAALTLGSPTGVPGNKTDSLFIRAAFVTDFNSDVLIRIRPDNAPPIEVPQLAFLTASDWYIIPRGHFVVEAYKPSEATPFYQKESDGDFSTTYLTVIVLGSEKTFELDILNEMLPVQQVFDPASGVPAPDAAAASLELACTPNPCSAHASIGFNVRTGGNVTLTLHDGLGRTVATLVDETMAAGEHTVDLNAAGLPAGVYYYSLRAADGLHGTGRLEVVR